MVHETEINEALRQLKSQGIAVSTGIVGPSGIVHNVMGILLTHSQILQLRSEGELTAEGIRAFAKTHSENSEKE